METLQELNIETNQYIKNHWNNGGASEFDMSINDISRAKIEAFHKEHGSCWMYKINPYSDKETVCEEYAGQMVYNFEFDIITKDFDQEILNIINERRKPNPKGYDPKKNMDEVIAIYKRLEKVNGEQLIWV